ncbi:MAG: Gfo/Idh/MocA family oxidoreductase [Anaerolineae bacterium]|nr:Gfo/Idh/MocA family oxidoreductase [Anaerolineae bacterium]
MTAGKLAVALVGCGGMGRRHIRGMGKLHQAGHMAFDLAAVCDLLPDNSQQAADLAAELLGRRPDQYATFEQLIQAAHLDAIILTTTPETHPDVGKAALVAGLHVMVEKPITLTVAQGARLVRLARRANHKLAVAENYRRDPINRLAKALIDAGAIGQPFLATQESSGSGEFVVITPWRHLKSRGGIVVDMGVHYTDILEFLLGPIHQVYGMNRVIDTTRRDQQGKQHPADAEDLSVGVAQFESGAIANWMLSMAGRGEGYFRRVVYGTGGSLTIPPDRSGQRLQLFQRRDGQDVQIADDDLLSLVPDFRLDPVTAALFGGERLTHYEIVWADIDANLLGIEQADFVEAIVHDRDPEVTGEQGLRSLALVMGFLESELIGRPVTADEMLTGACREYETALAGVGNP